MADVIKVGEVTHTIFDIDDILDIVRCECGSDVYAWLQNYVDEKELEIKQLNRNCKELEYYIDEKDLEINQAKWDYEELEKYLDEKLIELDSLQKMYYNLP